MRIPEVHEISLRLLRHYASAVQHQEYHGIDIVTVRVDASREDRKGSAMPSQSQSAQTSERTQGSDQEADQREPIAIVGMACRFPGAPNLDAYWDLLEAGRSAITESIPGSGIGRAGEIFEDAEGARALCRFGGFLDDIDLFDPTFFRLSPIEAQITDPQQRLMLETSWRALEDAGLSHDRLQGTRTGVYTGVSNIEYRSRVMAALEESSERATALYANTGTGLNGVSGRVSYLLGLEGPALAVDTACSSSLVAMHEAARALKSGEVDIALAGGVNVILDPGRFEAFAIAGILSPDGQCKAFDASANGWVRGEGCGVVVLKRLSDAVADGDRIWSVVRGSAVNHDGAGADFTAPNPVAHRRVIHDALADAGIAPAEVDYLEAHGTGTVIGDPVEAAAVGTSYAEGRGPDRPLVIGSAKTNIGHLEPAAGIAGLIKTVLAMQRRVIPRHLNFDIPNPDIDWDKLPIRVAAESGEWPTRPGYPPLAAVSSFGMSGTNGHIILEGYEVPGATRGTDHEWVSGNASRVTVSLPEPFSDVEPAGGNPGSRPTRILALSAKNDPALRELAGRYQSWLEDRDAADLAIEDMVWTASTGRSHFNHRAGLPFSDLDSLRDQLTELEEGDAGPAPGSARKVAFAYSGQGGQWVGMGREIYETEPVARAVMDRCEAVHREVTGEPLLDVMFGRGGADGDLDASEWTQPALYALDVALTALWASVGIQPDAVIGHSFGELPAAQAAGAFSIEDGMRLAIARGRLLAETESGAMAAIFAPRERVESVIEEVNAASDRGLLGIAVDNGVNQTVGGLADEVDAISKLFEADEVRVRRLAISVVGHSGLLEPVLPALEAFANGIEIAQPNVDFVSNVTGDVLEPETALDGAYWRRHARRPVAFADGVRTLERLGVDTVIEIGPHAVLGPMVSMIWSEPPDTPGAVAVIPSMLRPAERGGTEAERGFVEAVAAVYEAGLDVMFHGLYEGETRRRVSVPGYPFQLNSYWVDPPRRRRSDLGHALLGTRHESHRGEVSFDTEVAASEPAWLSDHRVFGRVVAPGALYGAMAATAVLSDHPDSAVIEDMQLHSPLIFPDKPAEGDDIAVPLQLVMEPPSGGSRRLEILSRMTGADWTLHVEGRVSDAGVPADNPLDVASVKSQMKLGSAPALYRARSSTGVELGPAFRGLTAVWEGPGEALGEIELPSEVERSGIAVHPLLLDACFQVVAGARGAIEGDTTAYMPFGWERLWLTGPLPERLVCRAQMREGARGAAALPPEVLKADVWIYDEDGAPIGGVSGYTAKRATRAALLSSIDAIDDLLYEVIWRERPYAAPAVDVAVDPPGMWILAADQRGIATRVATGLAARNQTVVIAGPSQPDDGLLAGAIVRRVEPLDRESWRSLLEGLPRDVPLRGVLHLVATGGHGRDATTDEIKLDVTSASGSALALVQALTDVDAEPELGVWFITDGGQVVEQNRDGALAGAMLWGFGKVVTRELPELQARVTDLDPDVDELPDTFIDELLSPDSESLVAYRAGTRLAPRLVRGARGTPQLTLPEDGDWGLHRDDSGAFRVEPADQREPGSREVRLAVEAAVLGDADAAFGVVCGRVIEAGPDVAGVVLGDRVVGFTRDPLGPKVLTRAEWVAAAPDGTPAAALAASTAQHLATEQEPSALPGLIEGDPAHVGVVPADIVSRIRDGAFAPRVASRWPIAQAADALENSGVVSTSPIATGRLRKDRTYLVTGGLGGIGGAVASWLADRGALHIVLNGRRAPDPAAREVIQTLQDRGVTVQVEIADVADPAALRTMLDRVDATLPALAGVIHSAGGVSDAALVNQDWDRFEEIVWAKVLGAWELHRATEHLDLDLFILFSSMSGVRGNPGQANYASANAFLDQLALHRRARGLPGQTIQWGAWMGVGAAEQERDRIEGTLLASGADWMTPQQGVRALDRLVRQDLGVGAVTSMDWPTFAAGLHSAPPLIEELLPAATDAAASAESADDLLARLRGAPEGERHAILVTFIQDLLQTLLRLPSPPAPNVAFFELGIDSLMALELRTRLNRAFAGAYSAPNTVAFDYPDTTTLAGHLAEALDTSGMEASRQPAPAPQAQPQVHVAQDAIAIVGMACRFPGADDLSAFWDLLEAGESGVRDARNGSGTWFGFMGDANARDVVYRRGAFVDGIDEFDAPFFGVSPIEARSMDPQLRLLLETTWHALDDAGIAPDGLRGSRTGIYAGMGLAEYRDVMNLGGKPISYMGINGATAIGRLAFTLGLEGPALPVDLACASALVAAHHAMTALRHGEVDVALVAGVNAALSLDATRKMAEFGMLSADGQCRTFDATADGYVRGEGCGVAILKRLDEALEDGDRIWATVRGSAVNQSGASATPTASNGLAQQRVIEQALASAGIEPADVDYLEAHGIASEVGDAIEMEAAAAVYGRGRAQERPLLVGTVKTNIGHTEAASGMAGLIKTVMSMQRGVIPAHLHFDEPSRHIEWERLPLRVTMSPTEWPRHDDREPIGGVSAFGLTGANAHLIVEGFGTAGNDGGEWPSGAPQLVAQPTPEATDAPAAERTGDAAATRVLPLSAKSTEALRDLARDYIAEMERSDGHLTESALADAAWTAGVGRSHFRHRSGLVFSDAATLLTGLRALADSDDHPEPREPQRVGFAFGDEITQWRPAARALYEAAPGVRAVLDACDEVFRAKRHMSLLDALFGDAPDTASDGDWSGSADYALQCALTALWSSVGVRPDIVLGRGIGELAAAHAAGVLTLDAGMRLAIARRGLHQDAAADSTLMAFEAALEESPPSRPSIPVVSSITGTAADANQPMDAAYWLGRAQAPPGRVDVVRAFADLGAGVVVDIGAGALASFDAASADAMPSVIPTLPDRPEDLDAPSDAFVRAVARAYEAGVDVAFAGLFAGELRRRVAIPRYPFQRRRYWLEPGRSAAVAPP